MHADPPSLLLQGIFVRRAPPSIGSGRELPGLQSDSHTLNTKQLVHTIAKGLGKATGRQGKKLNAGSKN